MPAPLPPVTWKKADPITAEKLNRMATERVRGISVGPGLAVSTSPDGWVTILRRDTPPIILQIFPALLGSKTPDAPYKRWIYQFTEVEKTSVGYGGWTTIVGGRTGDAYNHMEDGNGDGTDSVAYGNGVNPDNLPEGFDIQPIVSRVVNMRMYSFIDGDGDPQTEFWFAASNGIDGSCDPP